MWFRSKTTLCRWECARTPRRAQRSAPSPPWTTTCWRTPPSITWSFVSRFLSLTLVANSQYLLPADGNDENVFNISRSKDNKGVIRLNKRVDREAHGEHLLTIKCFPLRSKPGSLRKEFNAQVSTQQKSRQLCY